MKEQTVSLKPVDRVEIISLVDNYVDVLLPSTDLVTRPSLDRDDQISTDALIAEHGLSLLITVYAEGDSHAILFDTGHTKIGVPHNMALLGIDVTDIEAIVMSHRHMDHTGALYPLLDKMPSPVTVVLHPDVFITERYIERDDGKKYRFPDTLVRAELADRGVKLLESEGPTLIADDMIAVTGQVARQTDFEQGMPNAFVKVDGKMEKDPLREDQALAIHLKHKGLVVIAGCSHAGIVNTVLHAVKMTGRQDVYAVMGGFHLTGGFYEPIIERTIIELKKLDPKIIVPMHCTGWNAIQAFSEEFPTSFILNTVGSKYNL